MTSDLIVGLIIPEYSTTRFESSALLYIIVHLGMPRVGKIFGSVVGYHCCQGSLKIGEEYFMYTYFVTYFMDIGHMDGNLKSVH